MNQQEFAESLRELPCENCPAHLRCVMGRPDPEAYYCVECHGWWIPRENLIMYCVEYNIIMSHPGGYTGDHIIDRCNLCRRIEGVQRFIGKGVDMETRCKPLWGGE